MFETTSPPPGSPAGPPTGEPGSGPVASVEVRDLDARGVLDRVASARRNADREEARLLALVVAYVDLHPVTDPDTDPDTDPVTDPDSEGPVGWPTSRPLVERGVVVETPLAGAGTPASPATRSRRWPRPCTCPTGPRSGWSPTRSSCATGSPACGPWSRRAGCRRGRPARSTTRPPTCPGPRSGSWTGTSRCPRPATTCPRWPG